MCVRFSILHFLLCNLYFQLFIFCVLLSIFYYLLSIIHSLLFIITLAGIVASAIAAQNGMESTKTMGSLAGRSNYVEESRMSGIPDPGAAVIAEAFAVASGILG